MIIPKGQARINHHFNPFGFAVFRLIAFKGQSKRFVMHMDMIVWGLVVELVLVEALIALILVRLGYYQI